MTLPVNDQALRAINSSGEAKLKLEMTTVEASDAAQFQAILDRHLSTARQSKMTSEASTPHSLGNVLMERTKGLASEINKDQATVSKMLEQATRNGDSMQMMRAMLALNDYQMRVQFISKAASKASGAIDQLTKLQ